MAYRIGIDIGAERTAWATVARPAHGPEVVDGGTVPSVAAIVGGQLVAGADVPGNTPPHETVAGFVGRLGESDAIVVGGTPYGAEALVGRLIASIARVTTERLGEAPGAVVLVHDDGLDDFRVGMLTEAARVAGLSMTDVMTTPRREALAATPAGTSPTGLEAVVGAATLGWALRPAGEPTAGGVGATEAGIAAAGAAAGAAAAAGGAAVAAAGSGDGVAAASAAMAPPAGPVGSPLSPPIGAGPAGTPLTPPGAAPGTPLAPSPGPTGTTLPDPAAGPPGSPIAPPSPTAGPVGRSLRPRRVPLVVGATVAAVAVAAVVVVATNDDDPPTPAAVITAAGESTGASAGGAVDTTTAVVDTEPAVASASRCVQGEWTMRNDSFATFLASQFAGAGGQLATPTVGGSVSIDVAEDGTWTVTYDGWTVVLSMGAVGAEISVTIDGVDVSTGTFDDDGTFSLSGVSLGTTITQSATVNGVAVPIPPIDRESQLVGGSGTFTCEGDVVTLNVPAANGSFVMDRTG